MPPEPLTRQLLLVATAHIHWDPEFSDVKMVQTMMLMWELQKFVEDATRKHQLPFPGPYNCNSIPFVFCGDLNSLPDSGEKQHMVDVLVCGEFRNWWNWSAAGTLIPLPNSGD